MPTARNLQIKITGKRNPVKIFDGEGNLVSVLNTTQQKEIVAKWKRRHYDGRSAKKFSKSLNNRPTEAELVFKHFLNYFHIHYQTNKSVSLKPKKRVFPDFYMTKLKWMVEIDGGYHATPEQREKDRIRQERLEKVRPGWTITRFTNEDVLNFPQAIILLLASKTNRDMTDRAIDSLISVSRDKARKIIKEFSLETQMIPKRTRLNERAGLVPVL